MSYPTAELLGRVERRRRFSVEQKLAILTEATRPGATLSAIARRHGLLPAQVYKWRRLAELGVIGEARPVEGDHRHPHPAVKRRPELDPLRHKELDPL